MELRGKVDMSFLHMLKSFGKIWGIIMTIAGDFNNETDVFRR